ncbi:MAG TPA: PhnD/SsuA/transferrin family substrate-binding protein [Thermoanaerobaculia bacterium]|nr:PhnD/SsuA/transferrin family substrate-binding protein [Thermoanaerobaculia bacterium]
MDRLRIITYLSPSIPAELYELIARDLGEQCGVAAELAFEQRISGPLDGDDNLFAGGAADVGFLCAPSFRWLNATRRTVELLPLPVPLDARAGGRPVYFADVVVRDDSPARTFAHLSGARWSFNDRNSKSGWFSMLERIAPRAPEEFFGEIVASGSHLQSLELVAAGAADAAAIDSNVLRANTRAGLRVLESWGPFPIQPAVVRADYAEKERVAAALLTLHERHGDALAKHGLSRFVAGDEGVY